jgi:tetratricopeptide (TPR) repeat protein
MLMCSMLRSDRGTMTSRRIAVSLAVVAVALALSPSSGLADPSTSAAEEVRQPMSGVTAESEYNRGVRARIAKEWKAAEEAFRGAIARRAAFAEAWNELGYALRNQDRYAESLAAYDEALRLRPDFPEALEYLGEAYVKMGRLEDARRMLDRLRPLDAERAQELADHIRQGR